MIVKKEKDSLCHISVISPSLCLKINTEVSLCIDSLQLKMNRFQYAHRMDEKNWLYSYASIEVY